MVHKTMHRLAKDSGIGTGVICQWDEQDVALMHDASSGTKIDRAYLSHLEVGDRILVRGKTTVTLLLDENNNLDTHLSLLVHKTKAVLKRTADSSNDNGFSRDSGTSSNDESSKDNGSSSDGESNKHNGSSSRW